MRNLHIKYSSVHEICDLVRVLDIQQFHRAWPEALRFCRRSVFVHSKPNSYSGAPRVLLIRFSRPLTACIHFHFVITDFLVQHIWDLRWTKWHCDRFCCHLFRFPLSVPFHHWCILIHLSALDVMK